MTAQRWAMLRSMVEQAMDLPASMRTAYLKSQTVDPELIRDAVELIDLDTQASAIFAIDGWEQQTQRNMLDATPSAALIGAYRLLHEIGRGGMGAVYLAERADGAYQQKVALKILQESIFTPELGERFRQERQILARLSHPGIARLLDGGVTPDGRPYLVLEYVDGEPIDRFCETHKLDLDARLRLFLCVTEAVQSAHQQLVLHLDLKPANILVTPAGEPRLLDFGISRILTESEPGNWQTHATLRMLTPRYASPEQASDAPLGVASDIFSLATLLYRLLTGVLPYPIEDAPPFEAARIICNVQPKLPSEAAPPALRDLLRGDLDTILLQALRKEPQRRYPTVAAFAEDIKRHLALQPVLAHGDSFRYRAGKFVRRNRAAVFAAALIVVIVSGSLVAVIRAEIRAQRERAIAVRRLADVRGIAHSYVFDLDPKLEAVAGTVAIRQFVLQNAQKYLESMSRESAGDEDLMRETAEGYNRIGMVQETVQVPSLNDWKGADKSFSKSVALQRRVLDKHPDDIKDRGTLMLQLRHWSQVPDYIGDMVREQQILNDAWNVGQPLLANPSLRRYLDLANITWSYAVLLCGNTDLWSFADPLAAIPWLDRGMEITNRYRAAHPEQTSNMSVIGYYERDATTRAQILAAIGRPAEARRYYEEALRQTTLTHGEVVEDIIRTLIRGEYAGYLLSMGDVRGAEALAPLPDPAPANQQGHARVYTGDDADRLALLARISLERGRIAEGRKEMQDGLGTLETLFKANPLDAGVSSELAWDTFRLADEKALDPATRKRLYLRASEIAQWYGSTHPTVLSYAMLMGRCDLGLAEIAHAAKDSTEQQARLTDALAQFSKVLAAHPIQPEASRYLAQAKAAALIRP